MNLKVHYYCRHFLPKVSKQTLKIMKLIAIILFAACIQVSARGYSQISLSETNAPLQKVIKEIRQQSGYDFVSTYETLKKAGNVTVNVQNVSLQKALEECLKGKPLTYEIIGQTVVIQFKVKDYYNASNNRIVLEPLPPPPIEIHGRVVNQKGEPLPNVSVLIAGTKRGTTTNSDGRFTLTASDNSSIILEISSVGYQTKKVRIGKQTEIDVVLEQDIAGLNDVVVVGYGTQKKASLTGSVFVVKMPEIKDQAVATGNVLKALDHRVPGVETFYDGNPDNVAGILIRGQGSLNSSTAPLIIIDGVPTSRGLNELPPSDIASIQVLKDASAATIYGSRAANGVYIITTKSAKMGTKIELNSSVTAGFLPKDPIPLLNTDQHGRAQWEAARNDGINPNYGVYSFQDHQDANGNWVLDKIILPEFLDAAQTMKPANTDWEKVISRTAFSQNHSVNFSSGSEHGGVLLGFDYLKSLGTTKYNDWTRANLRLNSTYNFFNNRFKIGENFSASKLRYTGGSYLANATNIGSIVPVHTVDGIGWGGPVAGMSDRNNPLLDMTLNRRNHYDDVTLFGSAFADLEIIKNLHFRSTFGIDYDANWSNIAVLTYQDGFLSQTVPQLTTSASYGGSWTWNNVINYNFNLNNNNFQVMVGQEATKGAGANVSGTRYGFANEDPNYMYLNVGESNVQNGGLAYDNALNSYFGRLNYDYKSRYLLTAIIRQDGSSRFGADNRYATFPSVSGGWVISEENFMKSVIWVSNLKIRYGWGKTGNQAIDNYASVEQYQANYGDDDFPVHMGTSYDIYGQDQGSLPSGYMRLQLGNPNLKWETTTQSDFGLDFVLFKSKITGSFDYYLKTTSDILVKPPTLLVTGEGASSWINGATMKNEGWETILSYNDKIGKLGLVISANASHNTNKVTYIVPTALGAYAGNGSTQTILGHSINSFYGYVVKGIFQNQAQVDAAPIQPGKGVGRFEYADISGPDGKPDGQIDADDRTWIGVDEPKLNLGLNVQLTWGNFDLSTFWNSMIGTDIASSTKGFTDFFGFFGGQNYGTSVLNSWSPTNTKSTIPAITASDLNNEERFSTYFVENTSYMKLQSVTVGYNLPFSISSKALMKSARVFIEGENLWTINLPGNTFTGYDPKSPNINYQLPRSFTFGINLIF